MLTSSASDYYDAASERTLAWNDSDLNIDWQFRTAPILSEKGQARCPIPKR
jgi:dTDP-4-dehydrorhamnose 3,5-epimerase-like enzyme